MRWRLLMRDGNIIEGDGPSAPAGLKLSDLARDAEAMMLRHPLGSTLLVCSGVDLRWTVDLVLGAPSSHPKNRRALGLLPLRAGCLLWQMPDGSLVVAQTLEQAAATLDLFAAAAKRKAG